MKQHFIAILLFVTAVTALGGIFSEGRGTNIAGGSLRSGTLLDEKIQAEARIEPESPRLCDKLTLTVTTSHPTDYSVMTPEFDKDYGNFRVEKSEALPPIIHEGVETSVFRFSLIPTERGNVPLLPIPLTFRQINQDQTVSLLIPKGEITIRSERDPANVSLHEITGPQQEMTNWNRFYLIGIIALVLMAFISLLLWRRRKKRPVVTIELSPSERALKSLSELMASAIHKTDVRQFYLALTGIVRRFIEETTGIRAPEQTTEEFLRAVDIDSASHFSDDELRSDLAEFLQFSDLVKFAKFHPSDDEIVLGYEKARKTVLHDYQKKEPEEEIRESEVKS